MSRPIKMKAVVKDPQHCKRLAMTIHSFISNNSFCDVCFVCARGRKLFAHKLLLSSVSPQMKQMFLEPGVNNLDMITVHLPDIEDQLLRRLLNLLYQGFAKISSDEEYQDFNMLIKLLGINQVDKREDSQPPETVPESPIQPTPPQIQPQQVYYLQAPATSNSQGQVQYIPVMAAQSPQMMSSAQQPMIINQSAGQMVQRVGPPMQVQQMEMVQQNNTEMVAINNQMVAGGQIISADQIAQCSNQMLSPTNHQTIMANNQSQVGLQNQVSPSSHLQYAVAPQSNPQQYASPCSNNQMIPAGTTQSTTRMRPIPQQTIQPSVRQNSANKEQYMAEILGILQNMMTHEGRVEVEQVCERLEKNLNIDLENHTKSNFTLTLKDMLRDAGKQPTPTTPTPQPIPQPRLLKKQTNKRRSHSPLRPPSDDEKDEDFNPVKEKKKRGRPKKKKEGLLKQ